MFVSVIIPVYNIERWLGACMDGVLAALPEDGEAILVTGPSTDKSNDICAGYALRDVRVRVIAQNGRGLSNARNCGFDASRGRLVSYIDGDDYIDAPLYAGLLERLREIIETFDVVMTDYRQISSSGKLIENVNQIGKENEEAAGEDHLKHVLRRKKCFWNVWRYIYKRDFLERHNIRFVEGSLSEDMDYTAKVYAARPRFAFFYCPFYNYRVGRGDSLMDRPTLKRLSDTVANIKSGVALIERAAPPYSRAFVSQYQHEFVLNLALCAEIDSSDREKALALCKAALDILKADGGALSRLASFTLHIVPLPLAARLLHAAKLAKRRLKGDTRKADVQERKNRT